MPVIHTHRPRTQGERELDDAVRRAQAKEREMELRLDALAARITECRAIAKSAGVLDVLPAFASELAAGQGHHARAVHRREGHVAPRHVFGTVTR